MTIRSTPAVQNTPGSGGIDVSEIGIKIGSAAGPENNWPEAGSPVGSVQNERSLQGTGKLHPEAIVPRGPYRIAASGFFTTSPVTVYAPDPVGIDPDRVAMLNKLIQKYRNVPLSNSDRLSDGLVNELKDGKLSVQEKRYVFGGILAVWSGQGDSAARDNVENIIKKIGQRLGIEDPHAKTLAEALAYLSSYATEEAFDFSQYKRGSDTRALETYGRWQAALAVYLTGGDDPEGNKNNRLELVRGLDKAAAAFWFGTALASRTWTPRGKEQPAQMAPAGLMVDAISGQSSWTDQMLGLARGLFTGASTETWREIGDPLAATLVSHKHAEGPDSSKSFLDIALTVFKKKIELAAAPNGDQMDAKKFGSRRRFLDDWWSGP